MVIARRGVRILVGDLVSCLTIMAETESKKVALPLYPVVIDERVWYANGLRFECTGCGNCCGGFPGFVWVTPENVRQIAAYLEMTPEACALTYVRKIKDKYSLREKLQHDCVFLERPAPGQTRCRIYPVRPTQCRTWPYWDANLTSPRAWTEASQSCPGMCDGKAPLHDLKHIETQRQHPENP